MKRFENYFRALTWLMATEASATGYQTQSSASVDVSAADATQSFVLVP